MQIVVLSWHHAAAFLNTHSCYVTDTTEGPLEIQQCHEKKKRQWKKEGWTGFELIAED